MTTEFEKAASARKHRHRPCQTAAILLAVTSKKKADLIDALERDPRAVKNELKQYEQDAREPIPTAAIAEVLARWGYDIPIGSLNNHRYGKCICYAAH